MNFIDIGIFLKIIRKELHISQESATEIIGISDRTLRNIECGKRPTSIEILFKFCDLYGISGNEIWLFYKRDPVMDNALTYYKNKMA